MLLLRSLVLGALLLLAPRALAFVDDPEQREPKADAPEEKVFAWRSKGELRYTWVLPKGYDAKTPRNLTVILHGTGLDYRWGHWNNPVGLFRPDDVVVSVDGTSPGANDSRLFLGEPKDAQAFKAFLDEMRATFAVDRVYLYGHSQGGFFVVYYAGEFPDTVSGVVAHASGAWNWSKTTGDVKKVAIAFLHGTSDPVVPYGQSPGSRDAYEKAGFELLHLRRLHRWTHWPAAVRATETLDWCQGMTAKTPEEALACAKSILAVKPPDDHQWTTVVGFAGARDVLRRIEGKGPAPFKGVDAPVAAEAKKWIDAIETHAAEHVAEIRKSMPKKELALDGKPWLGHLVPMREDFRGVDAFEAFAKEIGLDKKIDAQSKATRPMWDAYWKEGKPEKAAPVVLDALSKCFLLDGFPEDFDERVKGWRALTLPGKPPFAAYDAWSKGWADGWKEYEARWKQWDGPKLAKNK